MSLIPSDYRSTFMATRDCRPTTEHRTPAGVATATTNIVVYVNPTSAQQYQNNANPLPDGTLVVKEEHDSDTCDHVIGWSVAHKEPGFDPAHGNWHWQHVLRDGTVEVDGRADVCSNSGCHGASACVPRDWMCTLP